MGLLQPYLSSSAVNSGVAVDISGVEISVVHKNSIKTPNFPAKFTTGDAIGAVDFLGYENDKVTINGIWNEKTNPLLANLKAFAKETSSVYLYDPIFFSTPQQIQIDTNTMVRNVDNSVWESGSDKIKGPIVKFTMEAWTTT